MRALILIAALSLLTSCSRPVTPQGSSFAEQTAGMAAGTPRSCVEANSAESLHAIDPQTVAYGSGNRIYVNRLAAPCPGLDSLNTIIVDAQDGNRYCRGNLIRVREPGALIPGPACVLRDWIPYSRPSR